MCIRLCAQPACLARGDFVAGRETDGLTESASRRSACKRIMNAMESLDILAVLGTGKANALSLSFLYEVVAQWIVFHYTAACRWRSEHFRLTKKKGSGSL